MELDRCSSRGSGNLYTNVLPFRDWLLHVRSMLVGVELVGRPKAGKTVPFIDFLAQGESVPRHGEVLVDLDLHQSNLSIRLCSKLPVTGKAPTSRINHFIGNN